MRQVSDLIKELPRLCYLHLMDCAGQDELAKTSFPGISLYVNEEKMALVPNHPAHLALWSLKDGRQVATSIRHPPTQGPVHCDFT